MCCKYTRNGPVHVLQSHLFIVPLIHDTPPGLPLHIRVGTLHGRFFLVSNVLGLLSLRVDIFGFFRVGGGSQAGAKRNP